MKQDWRRWLTVALALVLALSVLPQGLTLAEETAAAAYGKVTADQVYLRKQPSQKADYWFRMDTGHVARIIDVVSGGGVSWYKVVTDHPTNNGHEYTGYVMSDYFAPLTAEEADQWASAGTLATTAPAADSGTPVSNDPGISTYDDTSVGNPLGEITAGEVNFRVAAGKGGGVIMKLDRGTIVEILSIPDVIDENHWYRVRYAGYEGYIMSTYLRVLSTTAGSLPGGFTVHGYVKLIETSANLRDAPDGNKVNTWRMKGEALPFVSTPVQKNGYIWYEVVYSGSTYWVRSDVVRVVDSTGRPSSPGTTVTTPPVSSETSSGYVITTAAGVNLRLLPFGEHIVQIKRGVVLPYTRVVRPQTAGNASDYTWYFVGYAVNGSTVSGYVRSDCVKPCNADGSAIGSATATPEVTVTNAPATDAPATGAPATNVPTAVPTAVPATAAPTVSYVKTVKTEVAFRKTPGGAVIDRVPIGTVATVTGETRRASNFYWYPVRLADGRTGYLRGDCVVYCDANGNTGGSSAPGNQPTATPTPSTGSYGYVQITMDKTFIRETMNGNKLFRVEKKGGVYPMWGPQNSKNNIIWYPIIINGVYGWVRGDCAKTVSGPEVTATPTPTAVPTATPASDVTTAPTVTDTPTQAPLSAFVITTLNNVNLRASASTNATSVAKVSLGTVLAYNTTTTSGGDLWYRVVYNNQNVWVMGTCVKIMTQAEYDAWLAEHPDQAPSTSAILGYVKTTADKVNIRAKATTNSDKLAQVAKTGTVMPYMDTKVVGKVTWYYVEYTGGIRGWVTGQYLVMTDANGTVPSTPTPSAPKPTATPGGSYTPPTAGQEATYVTLMLGSTGQAVTNLVTELKQQGFYNGTITSIYTSEVEAAVRAFQKAKGLTADGIAGSETQHALFQTVPIGSGSNVDFTFYPAEKIDWFTGTINQDWAKGTNAKVYDVMTGIVWTLHRWSGGNHVEAEPLTAADTARMCQAYGVSKASEIPWNYRPVLVLIGEHNYCASIYAEEHAPELDTIPNNNFSGPMCVHFTNSKTHDTNRVNTGHQENIEYAYQHAPLGHK